MGLFGALFAGVSALRAQGVSLATISDNIANVSTIGYKGTTARFSSFVAEQAGGFSYSAGGVRPVPVALIDRQGELEGSTSSTDLAISGDGFFVVNTSSVPGRGELRYTRAGAFTIDREGHLVNTSGHYLMGWPTDNEGTPIVQDTTTTAELQLVNVNNLANAAVGTTEFSLGLNLPSDSVIGDSYTAAATVFDGFGGPHGVNLTFTRQPAFTDDIGRVRQNVWNVSSRAPDGASTVELKDSEGNTFSAAGRLDFNAIPEEGETLVIGTLTFEFDDGDGVAEGNIGIPLRQIESVSDAKDALVNAYYTAFGRFEGPVSASLASELNTLGGRFAALPAAVNLLGAGNISEAAFNILQGAFEEGTDDFSINLETRADGEVIIQPKTNIAFGIDNERITDDSFGRASSDLSNVVAGQLIRVYVREGPGGFSEVFQLEVGAGGIEAGTEDETTIGAVTLDGFQYQSGGYPAFATAHEDPVATGGFNSRTTTTTVQAAAVPATADAVLRAVGGFTNNALSLNLEASGSVAGAAATDLDLDAVANISYQIFSPAGADVGGNTRLAFNTNSGNLIGQPAGSTVGVFVNDGGAAVRVATINLNDVVRPGTANGVTDDAVVIGGFTYNAGTQGYTGPNTTDIGGTEGGSFGATAPDITSVAANIPESVRQAIVQTGRMTPVAAPATPDELNLDLERVAGEIRLGALPNISYRLVDDTGAVVGGGLNAYRTQSPDLTTLAANDTIELYVDSNGGAPRGDPILIATLELQNAVSDVGSVVGGITENALQITGFAGYTPGGLTAVGAPPVVAGVSPSTGGDFPDGTEAILPEADVAPGAAGILNSLGGDIFNDVTRILNLQLQTIADPAGGVDRQTSIAAINKVAFVHNSGGTNPTVPISGDFPGAFGQPSIDLTQGIAAGDTIDIYVDVAGTPSLVAQITLPGPVSDIGTVAGERTTNALQIGGFVYETDRRLEGGTDLNNQTVFFTQNLEGETVNFDASEILSIDQDREFRVPAIVATDPPNVVFTGRGIPASFNLSTANIQWSNGADDSEIEVNLGEVGVNNGITQFDGEFTVNFVRQDGVPAGSIAGVSVGEGGELIAGFSNGRNQTIYDLPLATFSNTNALIQDSGNVYNVSSDSGEPLLRSPGVGSTGRIAQNSLETSTVDMANEFSRMIITQRAFSAASRVVTTSDEMLDELVRIKR